jgi:AraC-like DNA-binding protein
MGPLRVRPVTEHRAVLLSGVFYHGRYVGFSADVHAHATPQILLPLAGRMLLDRSGESFMVGPEQGIWIPAGTPHAFTPLDDALQFVAVDLARTPSIQALRGLPRCGLIIRDPALWLTGQLIRDALVRRLPSIEPYLEACLILLETCFERALSDLKGPDMPSRILPIVAYIREAHGQPLTVEAIARRFAMSLRHLERCFREEIGVTPREFIVQTRIQAACEHLRDPQLTITGIASATGFQTPSHFTETFRKVTGQTPSTFRRLNI